MPNFPSCPPPPLLSQHTLHPQLTSRPEAFLPNPATSTLFHTVPPADLPLFSPLLNSLPHHSSCSLGLDSLHHYHLALKPLFSRPKRIYLFFAFAHKHRSPKENNPVLENFAGCARAPRIHISVLPLPWCRATTNSVVPHKDQLYHSPLTNSSGVDTFKPTGVLSSRSGEDDHRCHITPFGYHVRIPLG